MSRQLCVGATCSQAPSDKEIPQPTSAESAQEICTLLRATVEAELRSKGGECWNFRSWVILGFGFISSSLFILDKAARFSVYCSDHPHSRRLYPAKPTLRVSRTVAYLNDGSSYKGLARYRSLLKAGAACLEATPKGPRPSKDPM